VTKERSILRKKTKKTDEREGLIVRSITEQLANGESESKRGGGGRVAYRDCGQIGKKGGKEDQHLQGGEDRRN